MPVKVVLKFLKVSCHFKELTKLLDFSLRHVEFEKGFRPVGGVFIYDLFTADRQEAATIKSAGWQYLNGHYMSSSTSKRLFEIYAECNFLSLPFDFSGSFLENSNAVLLTNCSNDFLMSKVSLFFGGLR